VATSWKLKNPQGRVAMDVTSLEVDGDVLKMKGVALGSMPLTIALDADDVYAARVLLSGRVVAKAVSLFLTGWRHAFAARAQDRPGDGWRIPSLRRPPA